MFGGASQPTASARTDGVRAATEPGGRTRRPADSLLRWCPASSAGTRRAAARPTQCGQMHRDDKNREDIAVRVLDAMRGAVLAIWVLVLAMVYF